MRRTMNIGRLSKRIAICKFVDAEDAMGQSTQKLSKVAEVWGDINPIRGTEFYELKKIQSKVTHKCYIRWYAAYADINSNWFLMVDDKYFDIDSAIDVDYQHKMLEIRCYERINKEGHEIEVPEPDTPSEDPETPGEADEPQEEQTDG